MVTDDAPTISLDWTDDTSATVQSPESLCLLFGLSLATALPPAAILPPRRVAQSAVRAGRDAILQPPDLAAALGRPPAELWRGRVQVGEIDQRLHGLEMLLQIVRMPDASGALVCLSVVSSDPSAHGAHDASPAGLWQLAREALVLHGVPHQPQTGLGDAAVLAGYGGVTAQVVWLAGAHLATASVTSLDRETTWAARAARALAVTIDRHLTGSRARVPPRR
ncbi:MAG: hypothetical protein U0893_25100 [Chloroflexota bacterium]